MCFFSKQAIGLDIADHTIEVAELIKTRSRIKVFGLARIKLAPGVVVRGRVKDQQQLAQSIKEALAQAKPKPIVGKKIIFGLPESQVYTQVFTLDNPGKIDDRTLKLITEEKIRQTVPLTKDDLLYSSKVLIKTKERLEILVVAASLGVVREWQCFFQTLKLAVEFFDIETLAVFRGLFDKISAQPVCVVDIGAVTTNISIFDQTGLRYSGPVAVAGDDLTQVFVQHAKRKDNNLALAEEAKIKFNLAKNKDNKTTAAVTRILDQITLEIKTAIKYFQEQTSGSVTEVVLVGGSSQLLGMVEYFKNQLNLTVRLGASRLLPGEIPLIYVETIGLCLKALNRKQYKQDPVFLIKSIKSKVKLKGENVNTLAKTTKTVIESSEDVSIINDIEEENLVKTDSENKLTVMNDGEQAANKTRSRLITLVVVLIVGAIAIYLAWWYRSLAK